MQTIRVKTSKEYDVVVGKDLISKCGGMIKNVLPKATKLMVFTDTNVAKYHLETVKASLEEAGFEVFVEIFEAGEKSKNLETIASLLANLATNQFTRTDAIVALGGGVAGDMGGFAASIFLRGISVVQISTSLLSQVDASVGGKTGIDLPQGKNLVGAFHQPKLVIADVGVLRTLPDELFTEGMAEVIKYAMIRDAELYDLLMLEKIAPTSDPDKLEKVVARCISNKAEVVALDEHDNGLRQTLNYGHTVGHVIERNSNFTISHGVAVACGMALIAKARDARMSKANGACGALANEKIYPKLCKLLELYGLPTDYDITARDAASGSMNDKKKRGNELTVVVVERLGEANCEKMSVEQFEKFLEG